PGDRSGTGRPAATLAHASRRAGGGRRSENGDADVAHTQVRGRHPSGAALRGLAGRSRRDRAAASPVLDQEPDAPRKSEERDENDDEAAHGGLLSTRLGRPSEPGGSGDLRPG